MYLFKPGKGAGIWWVIEPHSQRADRNNIDRIFLGLEGEGEVRDRGWEVRARGQRGRIRVGHEREAPFRHRPRAEVVAGQVQRRSDSSQQRRGRAEIAEARTRQGRML